MSQIISDFNGISIINLLSWAINQRCNLIADNFFQLSTSRTLVLFDIFNISQIIREWLPIWQMYLPKIDQILSALYEVFFNLIVQHISHNSNPIFTTSGTGNSLCSDEQILLPLLKKSGYLPRELLDGQTLSEYLIIPI